MYILKWTLLKVLNFKLELKRKVMSSASLWEVTSKNKDKRVTVIVTQQNNTLIGHKQLFTTI